MGLCCWHHVVCVPPSCSISNFEPLDWLSQNLSWIIHILSEPDISLVNFLQLVVTWWTHVLGRCQWHLILGPELMYGLWKMKNFVWNIFFMKCNNKMAAAWNQQIFFFVTVMSKWTVRTRHLEFGVEMDHKYIHMHSVLNIICKLIVTNMATETLRLCPNNINVYKMFIWII